MKRLFVAAAMAGGLLFLPLSSQTAAAVPAVKIDTAKAGNVNLVKRGRGGGRSIRGGGRRSFGGGGRRGFRGYRGGGRKSFRGYRGGGKRFRGRVRRGKGHRRYRSRRRSYYVPYVPYYYYSDYGYYYDDDCEWLRRKALATDRSYWWRRYDRCIND